MNILAQVVGILAIIALTLSPQQKTKKKMLVFQLISSILYALQYFLLNAFSAVVTNMVGAIKNFIFYRYENKKKEIPVLLLYIYVIIIIVLGIFTFNNIYSLMPIVLSILYAYATWQDNLKVYRIISIIGAIAWIIYNCIVGAYVSAVGNVIQLFSAIIAVVRLDVITKNVKKEINHGTKNKRKL